jgi:hypothetical protein
MFDSYKADEVVCEVSDRVANADERPFRDPMLPATKPNPEDPDDKVDASSMLGQAGMPYEVRTQGALTYFRCYFEPMLHGRRVKSTPRSSLPIGYAVILGVILVGLTVGLVAMVGMRPTPVPTNSPSPPAQLT